MQALSQAIEAEVEGTLHCALEPVDMRLKPPTAEQFHANLKDLLQRGETVAANQASNWLAHNECVAAAGSRQPCVCVFVCLQASRRR
jgi:hypothetical protein